MASPSVCVLEMGFWVVSSEFWFVCEWGRGGGRCRVWLVERVVFMRYGSLHSFSVFFCLVFFRGVERVGGGGD